MNEALTSLIAAVELRAIRTAEGSFRSLGPVTPSETQLLVSRDADAAIANGVLVVIARVGIDGRAKGAGDPTVSVHCAIELTYGIPDGFTPDQATAKEFALINGIFNAWPFARAFIHTSFANMGLPPFELPVLRLKALLGAPQQPQTEVPKLKAGTEQQAAER